MEEENAYRDAVADDAHRRAVKHTESYVDELLYQHSNRRRGKLRQMTAKFNEMEHLMENELNLETVKTKMRAFKTALEEFKESNISVLLYLNEEEKSTDQDFWFKPKEVRFQEFIEKADMWIKTVELQRKKSQTCEDEVTQWDSVSMVARSKVSKASSGRSTASARLKEEAKRAALEAKAASLKQKQALALKEAQIQTEKEELEIQMALAEVNAKIKIYEGFDAEEKGDAMNEYAAGTHTPYPSIKKESFRREAQLPDTSLKTSGAIPKSSGAIPKLLKVEDIGVTPREASQNRSDSATDMCKVLQQQAGITEMLVKHQLLARLPQRDVPVFCGDPLDFRSFLKAFEHTVDSKADNSADKMYFLEQYTRGEPRDLVKSCQHMPPDRGYVTAMHLLEDRYGNKLKIATALMEKMFKWPQIKSEDAQALNSFSLFLVSCRNVLEDVDYMDELDNPTNMRVIISKLPYKIRERWRAFAFEIQDRDRRRVKFTDLVIFVDKQAKITADPLFGDLQGPTPEKEKRSSLMNKTAKKEKVKGSSFATYVTAQKEKESDKKKPKTDRTPNNVAFTKPCLCCKRNHTFVECNQVTEKAHKDKLDFIRKAGLCFGCLVKGHLSKDCKKKLACQICSEKHPTMLHIPRKEDISEQVSADSQEEASSEQTVVSSALVHIKQEETTCSGAGEKCVLAILPVRVKSTKGSKIVETYAFVDPGSSATFCTDSLARELNLHGKGTELVLTTMSSTKQVKSCLLRDLEVCGLEERNFISLPKVYTQKTIPVTRENIPTQQDIDKWSYLQEVKLPCIDAEIGILIGNNVHKAFEPWKVIHSQNNGPYAVKTILGWTVNGPLREQNSGVDGSEQVTVNRISVDTVENLLIQQYNVDFPEHSCNDKLEMSQEDKQFISSVSSSVHHVDGHYYINMPTKTLPVSLPNNRNAAVQRALTLKKKLIKNPAFHQEYKDYMSDLIKAGYAVKVPETQLKRQDGKVWYIPHHGVYHPQKGTFRTVFDCAASFQGTSLNKELLQGPDLSNSLIGVLTRFRQDHVAIMADIRAMYHQVRVPEEDTDLLRFLWWPEGDLTQEVEEYKMVVHLFGATSSPSCAIFALRRTAEENRTGSSPQAVETVLRNFYVDDCLKAVSTDSEAIALGKDLVALCASGGFHLTKWASNSRAFLMTVPENERAKEVKDLDLAKDALPVERALGVLWCIESDCFKFRVNLSRKAVTRRGVLSVVSSIYDPLGFLAPVVLPAKNFLQQLCKEKLTWDEEIPDKLAKYWNTWTTQLPQLSNFRVRRCIKPERFGSIASAQLHHFSDASESGYGTVSFLKLINSDGEVHCAFMMGKARVAPLKQTTIPRLELSAAVVSVKMDALLRRELQLELKHSVFWTDSTAVLKYIGNDTLRLKTFVANRVAIIKEATKVEQWRHVKTTDNPADCASRGLTPEQFMANKSWIKGPSVLTDPDYECSTKVNNANLSEDDDEVRKTATVHSTQVAESTDTVNKLMDYYSSWHCLKRAVAWILRLREGLLILSKKRKELEAATSQQNDGASKAATNKSKEMQQYKATLNKEPLTMANLTAAETEIIRYCQNSKFQVEISTLKRGKQLVKGNSPICKLDPVLQNGILRVGGRLSKSAMPEESKHPIIMPNDMHPTMLLLRDIHEKVGHSGRNHMLSRLRQRFWIPSANSAVRKLISRCVTCRKIQAKAHGQKMADLPADRLLPDKPPFTGVGVDYFGPIEVKRGRSIVKRYGVLFTCLTTRAVHLEVSHTLDTDSCINALRRFMCRRGQVSVIRSDNGTNLVSAEKELRAAMQQWDVVKIQDTLAQKGVQSIFNPPAGPHFSGVWERQVKSVKKVLKSVLHEQRIDDECLQTLLCEVENILNDRPLTTSSEDPNDLEPLTPNHLLLQRKQPLLPPGLFNKDDCYTRRRWKQTQYLADLFWKRWVREYLPNLQERQKWNRVKQNLKPGDIVMILDDNAPRSSWLLGRVMSTTSDSKGLVRRVLVKTKSSTLERPVAKLCLICEVDT